MTEPSWNELQRKSAAPPPASRFDELCAMVFTTDNGKDLLKELRKQHFELGSNPHADERHLRVRAANQQFVLDLERSRDRGLAEAVRKAGQ